MIVSTGFKRELIGLAGTKFAWWCQENFFKYMRDNYTVDRLADYSTKEISGSNRVSSIPGGGWRGEKKGWVCCFYSAGNQVGHIS